MQMFFHPKSGEAVLAGCTEEVKFFLEEGYKLERLTTNEKLTDKPKNEVVKSKEKKDE